MSSKNSPEAKLKFSMKTKEFEISGNEDFVNQQIDNFKELIQGSLNKLIVEDAHKLTTGNAVKFQLPQNESISSHTEDVEFEDATEKEENNSADYLNVLAIDGDRVKVIADVEGKTTSKKMISVILLYMWGKLQLGVEEITFKELRGICEEYGEVDKPNFAKHMNGQKKLFMINGKGGSQSAKLIRPGIKEAERLIKELNHE